MRSFELLGGAVTARLWEEDVPALAYRQARAIEGVLPERRATPGPVRRAVLEVRRQVGTHVHHGVLGGSFAPSQGGTLRIELAASGEGGEKWPGSLASEGQELYAGLPQEYAEWALDGALAAAEARALGAGLLRLDRAATGPATSVPILFRMLARVVVELLALGPEAVDAEQLAALVQPPAPPVERA